MKDKTEPMDVHTRTFDDREYPFERLLQAIRVIARKRKNSEREITVVIKYSDGRVFYTLNGPMDHADEELLNEILLATEV
ncbi:hypothetical protein KJ969_05050 [Patescibacteria group bacterium]|nr:hypothetical protein [Patescibacteria group bacterium]MBU1922281.1 hypothetical protein [Patescibacteria group bacterium]